MPHQIKPFSPQIHVIADCYGVKENILRNAYLLQEVFSIALKEVGLTILDVRHHKFTEGGMGVSGVFLLSESHLAYHTYPEWEYIAFDVYSCGPDPASAINRVSEVLKPRQKQIRTIKRGLIKAELSDAV